MPQQLKQSAKWSRELRQTCRRRIRRAQGRLSHGENSARVHSVRKEIKRIRATLRLLRTKDNREVYRKIAKALRKAGDGLATSRDARVMLQAFENMGQGMAGHFPELHALLRKHCRHEARRLQADGGLVQSIHHLRKARRKLGQLAVQGDGQRAFELELKRSFNCGRKAFEVARREPTSENFHHWRKQVKRVWHQLQLLSLERRGTVRMFMDKLELLGGQLGEEHDLTLLKQFSLAHAGASESRKLSQLVDSRRRKLQSAALKLGSTLFSKAGRGLFATGAKKNLSHCEPL